MDRTNIVMKALSVNEKDASKIADHLTALGFEDWIDNFTEGNEDEPLTDVHYESSFENMIDWKYENCKPSEMFEISSNINDHVEMLQLSNAVIFWYNLI